MSRRGEMPVLRREDMAEPMLAQRVRCGCGTSLWTTASVRRGACAACAGNRPAAPLPTGAKPRRPNAAKTAEPWTLERVAEILRVVEEADLYADLGAVGGIPYEQLTARAGAGLGSAYVVADRPLWDALTRLREVMLARGKARRERWSKPQRMAIRRGEEA